MKHSGFIYTRYLKHCTSQTSLGLRRAVVAFLLKAADPLRLAFHLRQAPPSWRLGHTLPATDLTTYTDITLRNTFLLHSHLIRDRYGSPFCSPGIFSSIPLSNPSTVSQYSFVAEYKHKNALSFFIRHVTCTASIHTQPKPYLDKRCLRKRTLNKPLYLYPACAILILIGVSSLTEVSKDMNSTVDR